MTAAVSRDEELRLALVMNGGVSLAVWIGGVAHEINRFVGETHPVYRALLELTSTRARVDVISGTSAGGVNGAALALASVYDQSLYTLRDLWLTKGAFAELLRPAGEADAASLLDGDGYYLPALEQAFGGLLRDRPRPMGQAPMDLALTSTMLHAEPHTHLDDLGDRIEDGHHRAVFHISRPPPAGQDDAFVRPHELAARLARAARASSSFPVAFEPRLFAREQFENAHTGKAAHYDRYLIDGGVLDNRPLKGALRAIFAMPGTGNVRRVLAYIAPDPAVTARAASDQSEHPPAIADVAMASLLGIPAAQSITDQLQQIDEHNRQVRRRRHTFAWLASQLAAPGSDDKAADYCAALAVMAEAFFAAYRERRIDGLLDYALEEIGAVAPAADESAKGAPAFGKRTRDWLKATWRRAPGMGNTWRGRIPQSDDAWDFDLGATPPRGWTWGVYALEFIASLMLDVLRRAQQLAYLEGRDANAPIANVAAIPIPDGDSVGARDDCQDWDLQDVLQRNRRSGADEPDAAVAMTGLAPLWARAYAVLAELASVRENGRSSLREKVPALLELLRKLDSEQAERAPDRERIEALTAAVIAWLTEAIAPTAIDRVGEANARFASVMANILLDLGAWLATLPSPAAGRLRQEEEQRLAELRGLQSLLFANAPDANTLVRRLLQLEVGHYSMAGRIDTVDAIVELVQISGRGQSPWGGPREPSTKLTGMQLAHFGAFYRKSWRANDWMMGRLDGIDRIVRIALNPDRLHRLYGGKTVQTRDGELPASDYVRRFVEALAINTAAVSHRRLLAAHWQPAQVERELGFLDNPAARVPEGLPLCAAALIRRLHLEVMCKELPVVARSVQDDEARGAVPGQHGAGLVRRVRWDLAPRQMIAHGWQALRKAFARADRATTQLGPDPSSGLLRAEVAIEAFTQCPVGSELLSQEFNSDLMTRTVGQVVSVTHAAIVGKRFGVASVGKALQVLTLPVRLFYLLASRLTDDSRTSAAISSALLVGGFMFVAASAALSQVPSGVAMAGWSLLLGWFGTAFFRLGRVTATLVTVPFAALALYLAGGLAKLELGLAMLLAIVILSWAPVWISAPVAALATLWWTTGQPAPADVGAALCSPLAPLCRHVEVVSDWAATGNAAEAATFVAAGGPVVLVLALGLATVMGMRRKR